MRAAWLAIAMLAMTLAGAVPAAAQKRGEKPFAMAPGKAYILFRIRPDRYFYHVPVLARALTEAERTAYLAARDAALAKFRAKGDAKARFRFDYKGAENIVVPSPSQQIEKGTEKGATQTYLLAVEPGSYVVLGLSFGRYAGTCTCMGSVRFDAAAGAITDMGMVEFQNVLEPLRHDSLKDYIGWPERGLLAQPPPLAMTVRPAAEGEAVPAAIAEQPIRAAEYRAVGKMPNHLRTRIIRMAPVPGVLDYRGDVPIDLRTGEEAQ